jgi:hypothetical protein
MLIKDLLRCKGLTENGFGDLTGMTGKFFLLLLSYFDITTEDHYKQYDVEERL